MIWLWALAMRFLRRVPKRYMSEERYDEWSLWLAARMFRHEDLVERAFGFTPAQITTGPRPTARFVTGNMTTSGATTTVVIDGGWLNASS